MKSDTSNNANPSFEAFGLLLMLGMTVAVSCAVLAEDWCEPWECTSRKAWVPLDWEVVDNVEGSDLAGRVVVVVEEDLYPDIDDAIDQYASDLADEGHHVVIATVNDDADPADLRDELYDLYLEDDCLAFAVLVGDVPAATYEYAVDPYCPPWRGDDCYVEFPTDMFYRDLDGLWLTDNCEAEDCLPSVYDYWDGSEAEIVVGRIFAYNLTAILTEPEENIEESDVLNAYFERNHEHRDPTLPSGSPDTPFNPADNVLAIENWPSLDCPPDGVVPLEKAFETVHYWCYYDGQTGPYDFDVDDYADMLAEEADPFYWINMHGHGSEGGHELADEVFSASEYLTYDTRIRGFTFCACNTCNYLAANNLGGTICFNPEADTLVVIGFSKTTGGTGGLPYYEQIGAGKTVGESVNAMVEASGGHPRAVIVLGDPTLRPAATVWTGGGQYNDWDIDENWDTGAAPGDDDHVQIPADNTEPTVNVNTGSFEDPQRIWSLRVMPADTSGAVTLNMNEDSGLMPGGAMVNESPETAEITMEKNSKIHSDRAGIKNFDITMTGDLAFPSCVSLAGAIADCAISAGSNCDIVAGSIDNCDISMLQNNEITVDGTISNCASLVVRQNGVVDAGSIADCGVDVALNGQVDAGSIARCAFEIGEDAEVTAGGISGSASGSQDWIVEGSVESSGSCALWGDWSFDGGTGDFGALMARTEPVQLELKGGSTVTVTALSPTTPTFPDNVEHELVYGTGANQLACGRATTTGSLDELYLGNKTRISARSQLSTLNLDLSCELRIASDFEDNFVWLNWDSRGVDIYMEPITTTGTETWQAMELISTEYGDNTPIFTDVPSNGQFNDVSFSNCQGSCLPTEMRNDYANEADGWDDEAVGFFHDVYIGHNRTVDFREVDGEIGNVIKYWGALDDDQTNITIRYWYLDEEEWVYREVDDESEPSISDLFIHVQDSIFGDWNGDCEITNTELDDLDDAIEKGPHDPLMDYNADGELTAQIEGAAAYANFLKQPSCGGGESGGGGGGGESEEEVDLESLAELAQEAFGEGFDEWVEELAAAAEEWEGTAIGDQMAALLEACQALLEAE